MTHPTDEELDALVRRMESVSLQVGVPSRTILDSDVIRKAAEAITALRAQLARREEMHDCAMKERDDATLYADEQKARADRAEAALAAQIEVDAGVLDAVADNWSCGHMPPHCDCARDIEQWRFAADEIRNQPHDRTALDRIIAATRAEALRDAADKVDAIIRAADDANLDERKEGLRDARNAITRMIPKEGA